MRSIVATSALIVLVTTAAHAQDVPTVVKRVHGVRFSLTVESIHEAATPGADPRHARVFDHRLRVAILDDETGIAVRVAAVTADVAEWGYTGSTIKLNSVGPAERGLYEGRMRLTTGPPYRILIRSTPEGGRTLEAQFEYRHHH